MDKNVKLNTLGLPQVKEVSVVINENATIKVATTIPYEKVFEMTEWAVNQIVDDRSFVSAPIQQLVTDFAILNYYTSLDCSFLDINLNTQLMYENYDIIMGAKVMPKVLAVIDPEQMAFFKATLQKTIDSIIAYRNSAKGLVDTLSADAKDQAEVLQSVSTMINDPTQMEEVKRMMDFYAEQATIE